MVRLRQEISLSLLEIFATDASGQLGYTLNDA